ncbi:MAG: helix-turn-helix domain-containing protein [Bryobacteraceae bacterium]
MAASPAFSIQEPTDVFERLSACPRLLTARELHNMLGISEKTIYKYVSLNLIPYYKIEANVRFHPKEIVEWLLSRHSRRSNTRVAIVR